MSDKLLFSVAGVRGIVGKTIDADVVNRLVLAFCSVLPPGDIVIGRDTRPSGESFLYSALGAVTASGRNCIDLGVATTPTVEILTEKLGAAGGIIITASHNPVEWNALKFLNDRGIFINEEVGKKVFTAFESGKFRFVDGRSCGHVTPYGSAAEDHIQGILALDAVDIDTIRKRKFKVVLDCINGAGSVIAPQLLEKLGADVLTMNCETNGDYYRDPEPRAENLGDLAKRVLAEGADVGFACDPDADRLALVDGQRGALSEEYTLALAVDGVLEREKGPVVVNMSTSSVIDRVAEKHGVDVFRTPVGEAHVVKLMLDKGAVVGGEGNGGVIYPSFHPGRDAPLGMALILQMLAERSISLGEQLEQYPPFHMSKEKVALGGKFSPEVISRLIGDLNPVTIDTQDGIKAYFDDGWFHVRISNTEGVVRVISEAGTEERSNLHRKAAREVLEESWGKK